ncbi:hypothetical protein [Agromyces badenianii]|nr:hypothetical protein [Agromyces badenianii]
MRGYAGPEDKHYTRLRRLLDGEIIMRLEDVVRFERTLGVGVEVKQI